MHVPQTLAALRSFRREPLVPLLVVATLGLAIGFAGAVFGIVDALLLRPLPFAIADRLVEIRARYSEGEGALRIDSPAVATLRNEANLFTAVEAYHFGSATMTGVAEPRIVSAPAVTPRLLSILGAHPIAGRLFVEGDARQSPPVVVISEEFWRSHFGGHPSALGGTITLDEVTYNVVGVLRSPFRFPRRQVDLWRVITERSVAGGRGEMVTLAVLAAGVSKTAAADRLARLATTLKASGALGRADSLVASEPIQRRAAERYRPASLSILCAAALVLLLAGINVANLLLVRTTTCEGELALCVALGSGRTGAAATVLIEAALLGIGGAACGMLLARLFLTLVVAIQPSQLTDFSGVSAWLGMRTMTVLCVVAAVLCAAICVLPVVRATRIDVAPVINRRARMLAGAAEDGWQSALVSIQLALVLVILATTGLLCRSFIRATAVEPGFDSRDLTIGRLWFSAFRYQTPLLALDVIKELDRSVETSIPGAAATYAVGMPPHQGIFVDSAVEIEGRTGAAEASAWTFVQVAPDYFSVMRIPLIEGRTFEPDESESAIIINDLLARRFWGTESPLGDRIRHGSDQPWRTITGVARHIRQPGVDQELSDGIETYIPMSPQQRLGIAHLAVRTPLSDVARSLMRERARDLDPNLPVTLSSMDLLLSEAQWQPRFLAQLALGFATGALMVSGIGVYGAAAARAVRRRREFAVRLAVGARPGAIVRLVLSRGLKVAATGIAIGLPGTWAASRIVSSLLFETSPNDAAALGAAVSVLVMLVVAGSLVPAIGASRIDPISVLKSE